MSQVIQVERLVDEQKIDWFNFNLLFWCFMAMFADGYDISVLSFAISDLAELWQVERGEFRLAASASQIGILFGAPLLGWFGDRYGRKRAIVAGSLLYGLATLAIVWVENLDQLVVLRVVAGIGIGGLMPNTISLSSELSPQRWRSVFIVLMFTGITLGGSVPGVVSAALTPQFGWQVLFVVGGLAPLAIAACVVFVLPESVKFLALRNDRRAELVDTARRMRRDLSIAEDAQFTTGQAPDNGGIGLRQIYSNGLALITPLLWLCFATALMANYFLNNWLPAILEANGMTRSEAALASSFYHVGGTVGGIVIAVLLDRLGFVSVATLFLIACPAIVAMGWAGDSFWIMTSLAAVSGFAVLGAQFGNNATSGLLYPTAFRSKGVGWSLAIGRFSSIVGSYLGGVLVGLSLQQFFQVAAVPMLIGVLAAFALARLCYLRFRGFRLDDKPAELSAVPAETSSLKARGSVA
jgi:AAHS family 4-hydroxybenzoate transporter-like MFS transporter